MRISVLVLSAAAALLAASDQQPAAAPKGDSISVDLKTFKFKAKEGTAELNSHDENEGKLRFYTNGWAEATVKIPADGTYEVVVKASCDPALNERAKFKLWLENVLVDKETLLTADEAKEYKLSVTVKAGDRKLAVEFTNDVYKEGEYDRNLYVYGVTVKKAK
jgi:Ca-dependent carbohydrate-binding module xylan-binding